MLANENTLAVHFRIEKQALYRYARTVERFVPWGPDAGAWRLTAGAWQPFEPDIDITAVEENARPSEGARSRRSACACHFLIERWPEEARDAVRGFPSAHWQLLQFVNVGGAPALELLRSNPALGYLAATMGAAGQVGLRRRSLAALCGFPETEHAVRLLRKVPIGWISIEFLTQLRAAMTDEGAADAVLSHLVRVNPIALEVARDPVLRDLVGPDCLARLSRVSASAAHCDLIARMRDVLAKTRHRELPAPRFRTLSDLDRPVIPRPDPAPRQPPAVVVPEPPVSAVHLPAPPPPPRQATPRTRKLAFPAPPLTGLSAPGVRICAISSHVELIAEGAMMQHCAGTEKSYARRVAAGRLYFYRLLEPERLTMAIRPGVQGWSIEEMKGFRNRSPLDSSRTVVLNWLGMCNESLGATTRVPLVFGMPNSATTRRVGGSRRGVTPAGQLSLDFDIVNCEA
jgi:hypothetical protein